MKEGVLLLDLLRIGQKLFDLRQTNGFTQAQIADQLFVSHQAVSRWETGKTLPSIDNLCVLMGMYQSSLEEILCLNIDSNILSLKQLFEEHSPEWVIHEIIRGNIKAFNFADVIHLLSQEQRDYALFLYIENNVLIECNLWPRLSIEERMRLLIAYKTKKYHLPIEQIYPQFTYAEKKKLKEKIK